MVFLDMFWSSQFISGLSISYDVTECLVKLHDYWASDIAFSLTLLSQFLEDMEAYAEVSKENLHCIAWRHCLHLAFTNLGDKKADITTRKSM